MAGVVTCVWFAFPFGGSGINEQVLSNALFPSSGLPSWLPLGQRKFNSTLNSKLVLRVRARKGD